MRQLIVTPLAVVLAVVIAGVASAQEQRAGAVASNLAAVFNTGANIGFSVIRAAYSPPDQPPPQGALDWMLKDMANAKHWSSAVQSCIRFDQSRFDAAASQVRSGTPAGRLMPVFEQLYRDYQGTIRSSTCPFGLPSSQNVEAFFVTAVLTGFATARASYFYYPTPIPSNVVAQIRQDFSGIRTGLPAAASCIGSSTPVTTRVDQLESRLGSAAGQAVYTELVSIYQQIEAAAGTAACAAAPPPPQQPAGGCTPEAVIRTTCASVCQGAGVLLGVVQGSPDCVACVSKACPR